VCREDHFLLLIILYDIPFQAEGVQKADLVILQEVPIEAHHQVAVLPVLFPEVPTLQGLHRGRRQVLRLHLILHQVEDRLKQYKNFSEWFILIME
jgi:hypothetical protein